MTDSAELEKYRLHAKLPAFRRHVEEAVGIIRKAISETPSSWALSYSGGKDSTVMLDLCHLAGWRGPILYQSYGPLETLPDNTRMVEWARSRYNLEVVAHEAPGEFQIFREVGHFFIEPETPEEVRSVQRWYRRSFGVLSDIARRHGCASVFLGLRMEESHQRRMVLAHRRGGIYYARTRRQWTCCPLYRWTGRDIWAYLVSRGLPWVPLYDAPGWDRERIRNDVVFCAGGGSIRHGQFAFWRRLYPDLFNRLAAEWPEIGRYI